MAEPNLASFIVAAKAVIANKDRMRQFMKMIAYGPGSIAAVQTIMMIVDKRSPIPAQIQPVLGSVIFATLVMNAKDILGTKPNPNVIRGVMLKILNGEANLSKAEPKQQQPQQQRPGLIAAAQGA